MTFANRIFLAVAALVGMAGVTPAVLAQIPAAPVPVAQPAADPTVNLAEGYVLGAGDVVEVAVLGREDYRGRVQVQVDGTIQLPLINNIHAADRTVLQLREDIRRALIDGGYFSDPAVSVTVATFASRYVTVLGEVGTPGLVPVDRAYRLSEIIARVGGTRPNGADEVLLRRADGQEQSLSLREVAMGGPDQDPVVNPGDKIFVAEAPQFFVYGQVNSPGSYRVDRGMTLRMAVARSGGLTAMGSERRIRVYRNGEEIRNFSLSDPILGGDVVVVGERFF